MFFKKKNDNDLLSHAIDVLMKQDTTENRKQVFAAFRRYVEEGKWLFSLGEMDGMEQKYLQLMKEENNIFPYIRMEV